MFVMTSSWAIQVCMSRRSLQLHLPVPRWPITPDHVWWSVPTRALKAPRMMSLSDVGLLL